MSIFRRTFPLSTGRFHALAAALAASLLCAGPAAVAAPPKKSFVPDDYVEPLDPASVLFGEVMFDFYNNHNLHAITNLLAARDSGVFSERDDFSDVILGNLYINYGLFSSAEAIFARLVKRDILAKTRNETWFHTAELQYNQGKYDEAARILENKIADLPPAIEKERLVMLGNIYIGRGEFQKAADMLATVKADDILGAYAIYNAGVAFARAGEFERGLPLLKRVRDLPPGDEETNALKDRAALAIGFTWLQKGNNDFARESLLTIRMDGPFTNQAMLGLGYANFQRGDFKKALPLWLELLQRNTSDTTVQEALMLAPRAYEELNALPQALFGYRYAADTLRSELKKVERTIIRVRESDWLDSLTPETAKDAAMAIDPLAPVTSYTPANIPEAPYLYSLFASNAFAEDYKLYLDLKRTEKLIDFWRSQIPIYQNLLAEHRTRLSGLRPRIDDTINRRLRDIETLRNRVPPLQARIEDAIRRGDTEQTATIEQLNQLDRARAIEAQLARGAATAQNATQRERLRRMKGLVIWDIAVTATAQQQQAVKDIENLKADLDMAQLHVESLQRLRTDIDYRMGPEYDRRLAAHAQRLQGMKDEVIGRIQKQVVALQNQALVVLAENRRNLGMQLAETHLSIARLQDASVSDAIEKRKRQ
ncbi:MAG: tetratricopeptide repeat protein [Pseudomonadota bacterium]